MTVRDAGGVRDSSDRGPAGLALTVALIAGAVIVPFAGLALWLHSSWMADLARGLQSVEFDPVRAAIIGALCGTALLTLVAVLLFGRPFVSWAAGGAAFATLFAVELPGRLGPQLLPHQVIDQGRMAAAVVVLIAIGVGAAGLGAGAGRALRVGMAALWRLRLGVPRGRLILVVPLVLLGAISLYGLSASSNVLFNGPWVGVVRGTAEQPNASISPQRQITIDYQSKALQSTQQAIVLLPAGYDSSPTKRFPVVYLLHGSPGGMSDWVTFGAPQIQASAQASGSPALIMVAVNGDGPRGGANDSFADGYTPGDNIESDIIDSLIPAINHRFRTLTGRTHTAIAGYSTGGYGAANLALRNPDVFGLSIVESIDPMVPPPDSFGGDIQQQNANNPLLLARQPATKTSPVFWVAWGTSDPAAAPNSDQLVAALKASGYTVTAEPMSGAHDSAVWTKALYDALVAEGHRLTR